MDLADQGQDKKLPKKDAQKQEADNRNFNLSLLSSKSGQSDRMGGPQDLQIPTQAMSGQGIDQISKLAYMYEEFEITKTNKHNNR